MNRATPIVLAVLLLVSAVGTLPLAQAAPSVTTLSPTSGPTNGGTTGTIKGLGFESGAHVTIGGVAATSIQVHNATTITAVTPAKQVAAANLPVIVRNPDGSQSTSGVAFTYTASQVPTITDFNPKQGPANGGTSLIITGTGFATALLPEVTIAGSQATVLSSTPTQLVVVTSARDALNAGVVEVLNPGTNLVAESDLEFTYTASPAPTLTAIAPISGTVNGGNTITLTGTNFAPGVVVEFGGTQAEAVAFTSATSLTVVVPAKSPAGAVIVKVTNPDGQSAEIANGYTYTAGTAPTVNAINPVSGPTTGGTPAVISGTGFVDGLKVTIGGFDVNPKDVRFISATQISVVTPACTTPAVVPCVPSAPPGDIADIVVTNPGGQGSGATGNDLFDYKAQVAVFPKTTNPTVPTSGGEVNLDGTGLTAPCRVFVAGIEATFTAGQGCQNDKVIFTAPPGPAGSKDVQVVLNSGLTATLQQGLGYTLPTPPTYANSAKAVTSNGVGPDENGKLILTGTGFIPVAGAGALQGTFVWPQVRINDLPAVVTGATATSVTVIPPAVPSASIAGDCVVEAGIPLLMPGTTCLPVSVKITNIDGQVVTRGGTMNGDDEPTSLYYVAAAVPELDAPCAANSRPCASSITDGGKSVTITGAGFVPGTLFTPPGFESYRVGATQVKVGDKSAKITGITATQIVILAPPNTAAGTADITVTNPDGQTDNFAATNYFRWDKPATPTILSLSQTAGGANGGDLVTINGAQGTFGAGAKVFFGSAPAVDIRWPETCGAAGVSENCVGGSGGPGTAGNTIAVRTPGHAPGTVSVRVLMLDGQSFTLSNAFTFQTEVAPTITSITPDKAPGIGGTPLTITGTGFANGAVGTPTATLDLSYLEPKVFVGGVLVSQQDTVVNNANSITVKVPARAAGVASIVVVNPDGQVANLQNGFRFLGTQTGVSLTPSSGSQNGGQSLTFAGSGFDPASPAPVFLLKEPGVAGATAFGSSSVVLSTASGRAVTPTDPAVGTTGPVTVMLVDQDGQTLAIPRAFTATPAIPPSFTSIAPQAGSVSGGALVTIKGNGFAPGVLVCAAVGAEAPNPCPAADALDTIFVDSQTVQFVTRSDQPGPVGITLTNPAGGAGNTLVLPVARNYFSYSQAPSPVVASIDPTSGDIAGGLLVNFTGANFASGSRVFFGSVESTSVTIASATRLSAVTPANAAGPVTVTVQAPSGLAFSLAEAFTYLDNGTVVNPPQSSTSTSSTSTTSSTSSTSGAPVTSGAIQAANEAVETTVTRVGDANRISFTLPTNPPAPIAGVQIWRSNSPFVLAADLPVGSPEFTAREFTDTSGQATDDSVYVVTVYYANGQGKATGGDPNVIPGFSSLEPASSGEGGKTKLVYFIVPAAVLLLLLVLLVVVLVGRRK